jgi:hypothetical protein
MGKIAQSTIEGGSAECLESLDREILAARHARPLTSQWRKRMKTKEQKGPIQAEKHLRFVVELVSI